MKRFRSSDFPPVDTVYSLPLRPAFAHRISAFLWLILGLVVLGSLVFLGSFLGDLAVVTDFTQAGLAPSAQHFFGTDWMGRDIGVRTLAGLSTSIMVGLIASFVSALIAVFLGVLAGIGPKWVDHLVTWLIDVMLGIPHLLLLILISVAIGRGFWGVVIGVSLTHWPTLARVIRAEVMQVKNAPYVQVAAALGKSRLSIGRNHLLPAVASQAMIGGALLFPHAIMHEAATTFLGFGLSPESAAIGIILSESMGHLSAGMWWAAVFPGAVLLLVVLAYDALSRALRALTGAAR